MEIWNDWALLAMRIVALALFWQIARVLKTWGGGSGEIGPVLESIRRIKKIVESLEPHLLKDAKSAGKMTKTAAKGQA